MESIGQKIYFIKNTGEILVRTAEKKGTFARQSTFEEDIAGYKILSERNSDTFDFIELEYGEYGQDFQEGELIGIDLEKRIPLFAYPNPEDPDSPIVPQKPLSVKVQELEIAQSQTNTSLLELMELVLLGGN